VRFHRDLFGVSVNSLGRARGRVNGFGVKLPHGVAKPTPQVSRGPQPGRAASIGLALVETSVESITTLAKIFTKLGIDSRIQLDRILPD
jgi:hypothetical protein